MLMIALSAALFMLTIQCDTGGDDDDDSGGSACETFCNRVAECGLGGVIGVASMDECLNYCSGVGSSVGNCVLAANNCEETSACFSAGDDDDDNDDNDDNDDTSPADSTPRLVGYELYISAQDIELFSQATMLDTLGVHERPLIFVKYKDEACDLAGGKMYYQLDDGENTEYGTLPGNVKCQSSELGNALFGYDLTEIDGAMEIGEHSLRYYWTDSLGNESNPQVYNYEVGDIPTAIGGVMADFTRNDENGDPVSLSDYAGNVIVIDGFAEWCTYCRQEAGELATSMQDYLDNGDPVAMIGLMHETNSGSGDIPQATLQGWVDTYGWTGLIHCLDDGDQPTVQEQYWMQPAFPFNMVLDQDGVIRTKWHGYGSGLVDWVIEQLLTK
jgi:peroxiredoxin